jgi:hypothetical protein
MKRNKTFALRAEEIVKLVSNQGYCFATDMITVNGQKVGYMYRESPDAEMDSGWRFFSGEESQEYVDNPGNLDLYDVNTIANYDPEIIPYLNEPIGSAFERDAVSGSFRKVESGETETDTDKP